MPKKKSKRNDNIEELTNSVLDDVVLEDDSIGVSGKIKKIQKRLRECEQERQEYLNGWQRARADIVNREKELLLERDQAVSRAVTDAFIEVFPILDSFDMAFSNKEAWEKVDKDWRMGVEQIYTQAIQVLKQAGISVIKVDGVFDPRIHEQVQIREVDNKKDDGRILSEIQKGYRKGDHILRPAKVVIGKFK